MSFITDYLKYVEPLEVPEIFHTWCAMSALSAAAQRKIFMDTGLLKATPNIYVVLVSEPGKCGKGTATNAMLEIMEPIEAIQTKCDSITKEAIFDAMKNSLRSCDVPGDKALIHCSLTVIANEMSLLIKKGDFDFVAAITSLYDCKNVFRHTTRGKGDTVIPNPYLNILGNTTPDWIGCNIHDDVIQGGLSARTMFVFSDDVSKINPRPYLTIEGAKAKARCVARLEQIVGLFGRVQWTDAAHKEYDSWYMSHHKESNLPRNKKMYGYHYRKKMHLLKTAMLICIADSDNLKIESNHIQAALALLNGTEPLIERSLCGVGRNVLSAATTAILEFIKSKGKAGTDIAAVYNEFSWMCRDPELVEIIKVLERQKMIQNKYTVKEGGGGIVEITYIGPVDKTSHISVAGINAEDPTK